MDNITNARRRYKARVQETWCNLTRDQLDVVSASRDRLSEMIQMTYGITEYQAAQQIRTFEQLYQE